MKKLLLSAIFSLFIIGALFSAPLDDVRNLIEDGKYEEALKQVSVLLKKSPKDAATNYWYGITELRLGNTENAIPALTVAAERGYLNAYPELVETYLTNYQTDKAGKCIESWRAALSKARKSEPAELSEFEKRLTLMANQLDRVEQIPVIARFDISADDFDKALERLSNPLLEKGVIMLNDTIPFFINNTAREVFWTKPDDDGINRLFTAGILDDGTLEKPTELTSYVGDGDIVAPFMLEDGETLYFASTRKEDNLGGYDLYMTRRDGEGGFYEPSSVGMPYNSPANDYLFVIDETAGIGWWITDRFSDADGSVAVLCFVPNATRTNVPPDSENLVEAALGLRTPVDVENKNEIAAAKKRLADIGKKQKEAKEAGVAFKLSLGNGKILTSTSQFRNRQAASLMSDVLRARGILADNEQRLNGLRRAFSEGDTSLRGDILALEGEIERQRGELRELTNRVIRLETSNSPSR